MPEKEINFNQPEAEISHEIDWFEVAAEGADDFLELKHSSEMDQEWEILFNASPAEFFSQSGLKKIENYPIGKRLTFLAYAACDIVTTPEMAAEYFKQFPEDAAAAGILFTDYQKGTPNDGLEFKLFSIIAPAVDKLGRDVNFRSDSQYSYNKKIFLEMSARRSLAPDLLLEGGHYYTQDDF